MKIYLLNPPYFPHFGRGARWQDTGRGGTLYYPIWLSYAAAILEQGNRIRLVDAPAWNWDIIEVLDDIQNFAPDLIVIDSSFPSLNNDISIAEAIKKKVDSGSEIVLVGPPASVYPDKILQSKGIDIVARWEYDFTLMEIVETKEISGEFKNIQGISYKERNKVIHNPNRELSESKDLDNIPFVSKIFKKYLNIYDYFLGQSLFPEVQILTGRGCPNQCTFCSWPQTLMGRKYRTRSIQNVLDEVEWIEKNLEVKEIFFEDDTFTINKKRVQEFCNEYRERRLSIIWSCNARADSLDLETMKSMRKANCRLLISGLESGSNIILNNIKKGISIDQMKTFVHNAKKSGLLVHGDFVIGLPGESKDTIKMTKNLIWELKPEILQVSVASPFPGTEFYKWCVANNSLITSDPNEYLDTCGHQKATINYPNLFNYEMVSEANLILRDYYLSIQYIPLALKQIMRRNGFDEFRRLLFSAKMFFGYLKGK